MNEQSKNRIYRSRLLCDESSYKIYNEYLPGSVDENEFRPVTPKNNFSKKKFLKLLKSISKYCENVEITNLPTLR